MQESSRPDSRQMAPIITGRPAQLFTLSCHVIHVGLVVYVLAGWLVPVREALLVHIAFVPALILTWLLNRGSCPLNNLESRLVRGVWRDPDNREEGGFLLVLVESYLGLHPSARQMDMVTYALMAVAWALSFVHLHLMGSP